MRTVDIEGNQLTWRGSVDSDVIRADGFNYVTAAGTMRIAGGTIADHRVWLDMADSITALYVQQLDPAYRRAPAAPKPDTKHSLD